MVNEHTNGKVYEEQLPKQLRNFVNLWGGCFFHKDISLGAAILPICDVTHIVTLLTLFMLSLCFTVFDIDQKETVSLP